MTNREIDALVAEKVMGMLPPEGKRTWWGLPGAHGGYSVPPHYSTDVSAAWRVVEKLHLSISPMQHDEHTWSWVASDKHDLNEATYYAVDATPERAICRAALRMAGINVELDKQDA